MSTCSIVTLLPTKAGLRCVYCLQPIDDGDDAQRISKREVAHTQCAFVVSDSLFAALDAGLASSQKHQIQDGGRPDAYVNE